MKKGLFILASLFMLAFNFGCDVAHTGPIEVIVTLTWTAPGDDNYTGQASKYEVYYSTQPITDGNFSSTTKIDDALVPAPQPAGTLETLSLQLVLTSSTTYYFAIRTADEKPNWSLISNNATVETPDLDAPGATTNLSATISLP